MIRLLEKISTLYIPAFERTGTLVHHGRDSYILKLRIARPSDCASLARTRHTNPRKPYDGSNLIRSHCHEYAADFFGLTGRHSVIHCSQRPLVFLASH